MAEERTAKSLPPLTEKDVKKIESILEFGVRACVERSKKGKIKVGMQLGDRARMFMETGAWPEDWTEAEWAKWKERDEK